MRLLVVMLLGSVSPALALPFCDAGPRIDCVVDGDTLWIAGEKIRLDGIDAPELTAAKCPEESALAWAAAKRLAELAEGEATIERHGTDRYGRTLAEVAFDARDLAETLLDEGLVREAARRLDWCAE